MKILGIPLWIIAVGIIIIFLLKRKNAEAAIATITIGAETIKLPPRSLPPTKPIPKWDPTWRSNI